MGYQKKFFSGNSIEQAVLQAARHFKLEAEEVAYRKVERRHGFLKSRRRAVIEVDAENPRREHKAQAETSTSGAAPAEIRSPEKGERETAPVVASPAADVAAPASPVEAVESEAGDDSGDLLSLPDSLDRPARRYEKAEGDLADVAQEGVRHLLALGQLDVEAEIYRSEDGLEVEISGKDEEVFLEDRGRLLLAMQHLLPRIIRGLAGETVPCRVDCDNFQEIRAEQLRVLAQKVAAEVRERGRPETLEPMSPDERRIVHITLADDAGVDTESQGSGLFKRVMVIPAKRQPRGFDPYN